MANNIVLRVAKKQLNGVEVVNNLAQKDSADKICQLISGDYLEVISKPLDEIQRYGTTVAWLFDLAVSIFGKETDKQQYGVLWANTGINQKFEMQQTMTANLVAAIYEYRLPQISSQSGKPGPFTVWKGFSLSRYWSSKQPVLAEKGERDQAYFSERVKQRDGNQCVISHVPCNLVTSHLIPNRLPHKAILMILQRQSGPRVVVPKDKWGKTGTDANNDERIAILAFGPLDEMIDNFTLGFYCPDPVNRPNAYLAHHFGDANDRYNVLGIKRADFERVPGAGNVGLNDLHNHPVTFADLILGQVTLPRPLHTAIRWHYMQCAPRALATIEYKFLPVW